MTDISLAYFVRVDHRDPTQGSLRVCNAGRGIVPLDAPFGDYLPIGNLLDIDTVRDASALTANTLEIGLKQVNQQLVDYLLTDNNDKDNPVIVHQAVGRPVQGRYAYTFDLVFLGRTSVATIAKQGVKVSCYPASSDLGRVSTGATKWSDSQQRQYVDADDQAFANASRYPHEISVVRG